MIVIIPGNTAFASRINDIDSELVIRLNVNHRLLDTSIIGATK